MEIKNFNGKNIKITELSIKDLKRVKMFRDFINSLVDEDAQILMNKRFSLKEEKRWMKEHLEKIKNRKTIVLVAEENSTIVGTADVTLDVGRKSHIGNFGITIRKGYRRLGLGTYLMKKILKLAQKRLKPRVKIFRLSVYSTNKPAIRLYKKLGLKKVAKIPRQVKFRGEFVDEIIMLKEI